MAAQPKLRVRAKEIHVWCANLDLPAAEVKSLQHVLSAKERARAAQFRPEQAVRFIVSHAALRIILAQYLDEEPEHIELRDGPAGKPAICSPADNALRFNVSDSGSLAVYAMASGREVGIDVERIDASLAHDDIAELFFSTKELATLRSMPSERRMQAFFNCWTRKEAYAKALGEGTQGAWKQFEVSLEQSAVSLCGDLSWSIHSFTPAPGYAAAVAAQGCDWNFEVRRWSLPGAVSRDFAQEVNS